LFTAMSGFLYAVMPASRSGFAPFVRRKIDSVLWPLIFGLLFYWEVRHLLHGHQEGLLDLYLNDRLHLWYLNSLMQWFVVVAALDCYLRMDRYRWFAVLAIGVLFWWYVPRPALVDAMFRPDLFPFFVLGILLYQVPALWSGRVLWLVGGLSFAGYVWATQFGGMDLSFRVDQIWRGAASAGVIILIIQKFPRIRFIEGLAIYSFTIYLWHLVANSAVRSVLGHWHVESIPGQFFPGVFFGVLAPIVLHKLVERAPNWIRIPLIGR
ncbi:MAG TPA: acyltransferase family protein, partial [Novosphingobium sp.]